MDANRNKRICGLVIAVSLLFFTFPAHLKAQEPPQVRMRWQDFISGPDGAKRLASLKAGIQKMKSLDSSPPNSADFRRSWQYWANIHGYYGTVSPDGSVEDQIQWLKDNGFGSYVSYYSGITDLTPPDSTGELIRF
jgi:tyrosinase